MSGRVLYKCMNFVTIRSVRPEMLRGALAVISIRAWIPDFRFQETCYTGRQMPRTKRERGRACYCICNFGAVTWECDCAIDPVPITYG